jgi:hypothetical protein
MNCGFTVCPWTARDAFTGGMMILPCQLKQKDDGFKDSKRIEGTSQINM